MVPVTVGSWTRIASMLNTRSAHAVVGAADAIYVFAGSGAGGPVLDVERFDGSAWNVETQLPGGGLNAPAAAVVGGRIYVIGGFEGLGNAPASVVHAYDPATGAWTAAAPLPAPRGGHAAAVLEGKIHVLGGGNSVSTIADHSVYDPATSTWSEAAPLPRPEGSTAAVVLGGKILAIGGRSGTSDFGSVDVYDPATDSWSKGPSIPPRGTAGAVVFGGAVYLFGGESQARRAVLGDVLRFAAAAKAWRHVNRLPTPRAYARAVVFHDAVYVVGGSRTAGSSHASAGSSSVERYSVREG